MTSPRDQLPEGALRDAVTGGWVPVAGASMEPLLPDGCRVRARPAEGPAPLGALVVFPLGGVLAVHRVVGRRGPDLLTKGDAALRSEPAAVPARDVLGVVVEARSPSGCRISLDTPAWRRAGRLIALASRAWDGAAALLPPAFLSHPTRFTSRVARGLLRRGNRLLPAAAGRLLGSSRDDPMERPG